MKQNVEFIRISRNGWDSGTYRGELSVVGASRRRHGRGVMDYDYGERYDGEWSEDQRSGRGVLTWSGGERYRGEFAPGGFHGRGAFHFRNGRLFEGTWAGGAPVVGVALGGDGRVARRRRRRMGVGGRRGCAGGLGADRDGGDRGAAVCGGAVVRGV